jgi:GT2 family glycosyltransferase
LEHPAGRALRSASVVVVVRNGEAVIARCLEALLAQRLDQFEVLVIDDGSSDRTVEIAGAYRDSGRISIHPSPGRGVAAARNAGLRLSDGDAVAYVDADGYPEPDWLRAATDALSRAPSAGAVAALVLFDGTEVVNGAGGTIDLHGYARDHCFGEPLEGAAFPREVLYPMGCGMVFRREALEQAGGFDEALTNYYDDAEAGIRLWRAGWRVIVEPGARVQHGHRHSFDPGATKLLTERHRIRTMLIHLPWRALPRFLASEAPWLLVPSEVRELKRRGWAWNLRGIAGVLVARARYFGRPQVPRALLAAGRSWDLEPPEPPDGRWLYGWYAPQIEGQREFRWGTDAAGVLIECEHRARGFELTYRMPPRAGAAQLQMRAVGGNPLPLANLPPAPGWRTETIEFDLEPGSYEVALRSSFAYEDARRRRLAVAVSELRPLAR